MKQTLAFILYIFYIKNNKLNLKLHYYKCTFLQFFHQVFKMFISQKQINTLSTDTDIIY